MMRAASRYCRLYLALARFGLARELAFRANFLAKLLVEVLWLSILIVFYRTVFSKTAVVATWTEEQYLFFVGCYFMLEGIVETFFLSNCNEFADLIRSGDLDFYLLKPIDEQFLVTCRNLDWSTVPNILMGLGVMIRALAMNTAWQLDWGRVGLFALTFLCGIGIAYSFLVFLTSVAVWFTRNQSLFEMWWLFTSFMRYPREIFTGSLASLLGWAFTYLIPILIVIQVPASVMVRALDDWLLIAFTVTATLILLCLSRSFFRRALKRYRSASS